MIIFGTRKIQTNNFTLEENCSNCNNSKLNLSILQEYFHVFWIPFFPTGKKAVVHCPSCNFMFQGWKIPKEFQENVKEGKQRTPVPLWMFVGLTLTILFVIMGSVLNMMDENRQEEFFKNPKVGDVYEGKTLFGNFVLYKLVKIKKGKYSLVMSSYETPERLGLITIRQKNQYSTDTMEFDKMQLVDFRKDGMILNVERRY